MANVSITLSGIAEVIENLNYRPGSVKDKAVRAIFAYYVSEDSIQALSSIDGDSIIRQIWDLGDDYAKIKFKRRNFSSLKSSINADLKKLFQNGLNPEDIRLTESNVFDMTEDAKNSLLQFLSDAVKTDGFDLTKTADVLKAVAEFLNKIEFPDADNETTDIIEEIKKLLTRLGSGIFDDQDGAGGDGAGGDGDVVLEDNVEIEEIEEDVEIEALDDDELEEVEEIDEDQQIEDIELDDDEDLEELEEVDEDTQIEDVELDDDESLEEIEDIELDEDQELEEVDLDEDEDLEELDELDEEEIKVLEEYRNARERAEQFDDFLGEREKKFNAYITIPAGTYTIGTEKILKSSLALQPFDMPMVYIGKYPVTNALFEIFIEQTGYVTTAERKGIGTVYHSRYKKQGEKVIWSKQAGSSIVKGACWHQPLGLGSTLYGKRNHPVVQISVDDAFAYASWIGRRLPTEAEWEAAARTDMALKYPWGNQFDPDALNIESSGLADTSPVDNYDHAANVFGMADMLGNVMEWTADTQPPPFDSSKVKFFNVAKGGAWNAKDTVTISSRGLFPFETTANIIGFRCISELFQ
ncbi:MAG: SUMF1/EgtB/PvdO family nonheme iron enzyme [Desulfobacter postgatei]|uniref:SUMF1/EgtB/PvdO family nonheme iron enzyme n=1 Tax=Desulfobacter postgatei TaxID=2293 RepID=UPI0023F00A0B|nr:SUMF1/EgtB/PvdO family nonheme iron enzyme [Desulfobacter postgatei]MDD4272238.1 SUMF1/EgtB/PvdO family nonheme iron enzyme [Desulfobacter postgatei]